MPPSAEQDFYAWAQHTAQALAEGRVQDIDLNEVAEEIEGMARSDRRALRSQMARAMAHMLKIRYQPGKHTASWDLSIEKAREAIRELFEESPSMRALPAELLSGAYKVARLDACPRQATIPSN